MEAAQNLLDFHQTATTDLRPSLSRRSSTSKTDQKGSEKKNLKRSNRLPRNRVDTSMDSRGKPPGKTQHKKQLSSRQPRANFSTADVIKEIRSSEVYVQCTCCSKRSTLGTVFCRCGKKLGGWTAVQEKNAQVIIEKGCQSIQSLVQLRITEQVRRGHGA